MMFFLIFSVFSSDETIETINQENTPSEEINKNDLEQKSDEIKIQSNSTSEINETNQEKLENSSISTEENTNSNIKNNENSTNSEFDSKQRKPKNHRNRKEYEARRDLQRERKEFLKKNQDYWRQNDGNKHTFFDGEKKIDLNKEKEIICVGIHSRPLWGKNKCVCEEGYFAHEDEINTTGCYTCEPKCHSQAYCDAPNVCKCKYGLIGDGLNNCMFPDPVIKKVHVPMPNQLSPVPVIVEYNAPDFIPYTAFCKFGDKKVEPALIFDNGSIACLSPDKMRGDTKIQISYDGIKYSKGEPYSIVPGIIEPARKAVHLGVQPEGMSWKIPTIIVILIIISIIAFLVLHLFNDKKAEEASREELQPLVPNKITPESRTKKREQIE